MKCIKFVDGSVKRLPDAIAYLKVLNKEAVYISKTEYKTANYGVKPKVEVEEQPESSPKPKKERQIEKKRQYRKEKKKTLNSQKSKKK